MTNLKPCPFCGGEAYTAAKNMPNWTWNWCSVICDGCGAKVTRAGSEGTYQGAEKAAIAAWNTRADRTCRNLDEHHRIMFKCSECGHWECQDFDGEKILPQAWNYCPNCGAKVVGE